MLNEMRRFASLCGLTIDSRLKLAVQKTTKERKEIEEDFGDISKNKKILTELMEYANDCINGFIISCKKHKLACKRFLKDIERVESDDTFFFYWNEQEAEKIIRWFTLLRHSKGVLAGQPIELTIWQKFVLCQIYGWRHIKTGYKRFKNAFIMVGRKNAKSQMAGRLSFI